MMNGLAQLAGLGADDEYAYAKLLFKISRPWLNDGAFFTITDSQLMAMWRNILAEYDLVTVRGADTPEGVGDIITSTLGRAKTLAFQSELEDAFNQIARRGYSFRRK